MQSYQVMHKDSEFLEFCSCTNVQQAISIGILTYIQAYASAGIHKHTSCWTNQCCDTKNVLALWWSKPPKPSNSKPKTTEFFEYRLQTYPLQIKTSGKY